MVQQKGPPQIFLTVTITEPKNPELLALLHENAGMGKISPEDAMRLSPNIKTILVKNDPVTIVLYFEQMLKNIIRILKSPDGPFGENYVLEYYLQRESQNRGTIHVHSVLWCKNAPKYEKDSSNEDLIKFIERISTCFYNAKNPFMTFQSHKHTFSCKKKGREACRFHFPKYVMPRTIILEPLKKDQVNDCENRQHLIENVKKINLKMNDFFKSRRNVTFVDMLDELNMNEEDYILAIRSTIKTSTVFLRRSSLEVSVNAYNVDILHMLQSNMDIQFILNPYACISYITDYINKDNSGLSKLLRNVSKSMENGNYSASDRLQKYANEFITGSLLTAQESVYIIFSLPLSECSIASVFINTRRIDERTRKLKSKNELNKLSAESESIYDNNIFDYYVQRHETLENVCSADFATGYIDSVIKNKLIYTDDRAHKNLREKRKILKYCRLMMKRSTIVWKIFFLFHFEMKGQRLKM